MTDQRAISAIRLRTALALALLLAACSPAATPSTSSTPSPSTTQSPPNAPVTTARTTTTSSPALLRPETTTRSSYPPGEYWWDPAEAVWVHNPVGNSIGVELSFAPWGGNKDEPGPMSAVVAGYEGTYRQLPVSADLVRTEVWVVDIEGTAMTITVTAQPEVTDAELAEAHAVVESIRTEPWETQAGFRMIFKLPRGWDSA